nr:flagellar basal body-associated FliL family protein [Gammaproteobacteria bacterium]
MADKEIQLAPAAPAAGGKLKLILIATAALVVLAGGGGAAAYFAGLFGGHEGEEAAAEAVKPAKREAVYVALEPPFTVNLQGTGGNRYFQTTVELLTRDPGAEAAVKRHLPVIRNDLVLLFSSKDAKELASVEGKERLRA